MILVVFILLIGIVVGTDRVAFVGFTNTFYGGVHNHGFIKVFQQETAGRMEVNSYALPYAGTTGLIAMLQHDDVIRERFDKVFLIVEADALLADYDENDASLFEKPIDHTNPSLSKLETMIAILKSRSQDLVLCSLLLSGESTTIENKLDYHFEAWRTVLKRLSVDYEISYLDFSVPFAKFVEIVNLDDLDHSMLTHEGNILNERGDLLVAHELLRYVGVDSKSHNVKLAMREVLPKESVRDDVLRMKSSATEI